MANATLNDIKLFLEDLLSERVGHLLTLSNGGSYQKLFQQKYAQISALPLGILGRPLADILAETDALHDNFGKTLYYATEAYQLFPSIDAANRALAKKIQTTFIPALEKLRESYADEAARATALRPLLKEMESELKSFTFGSATLCEVASSFITHGEKLGGLLSQRADATNATDRSGAGKLLSSTLGLVRRVRESFVDERELNPSFPPDMEDKLFGYLNLLTQNRAEPTPPTPETPEPAAPKTDQ